MVEIIEKDLVFVVDWVVDKRYNKNGIICY